MPLISVPGVFRIDCDSYLRTGPAIGWAAQQMGLSELDFKAGFSRGKAEPTWIDAKAFPRCAQAAALAEWQVVEKGAALELRWSTGKSAGEVRDLGSGRAFVGELTDFTLAPMTPAQLAALGPLIAEKVEDDGETLEAVKTGKLEGDDVFVFPFTPGFDRIIRVATGGAANEDALELALKLSQVRKAKKPLPLLEAWEAELRQQAATADLLDDLDAVLKSLSTNDAPLDTPWGRALRIELPQMTVGGLGLPREPAWWFPDADPMDLNDSSGDGDEG